MADGNHHKRRGLLTSIAAASVLPAGVSAVSGRTPEEEEVRRLFDESREILHRTNSHATAQEFLQNNGFNIASHMAEIEVEPSTRVGTNSGYQPRDDLNLGIDLNYYPDTGQYFATASWMWDYATLHPADVVALTYKQNSWSVPPNGYQSSSFVELDSEAPWSNGYAWKYHDHNHTIDNGGDGEWQSASLELEPYSDTIDPEQRYIWMAYTQNSGTYGGHINGIALGYGVLSVDTSGIDMTQDTWKRDSDGNDLKLSQADADTVGCC